MLKKALYWIVFGMVIVFVSYFMENILNAPTWMNYVVLILIGLLSGILLAKIEKKQNK